MPLPTPDPVGPGQESVWSYPRPPRVEPTSKRIHVIHADELIADTRRALRLLETSHPPNYYIPAEDVQMRCLVRSQRTSFCEWKGHASYYHVRMGDVFVEDAAWYYPRPRSDYAALVDHIGFYAGKLDECCVDSERAKPQPGGFYGGWITRDVCGPFKGGPGSLGW